MSALTGISESSWSADIEARLEGTATIDSEFFYGTGSVFEQGDFLICRIPKTRAGGW